MQIFLAGVIVFLVAMMSWITFGLAPDTGQTRTMIYPLSLVAVLVAVLVWVIMLYRRIVVTVDDHGVSITGPGGNRSIAWTDVASVAYMPGGIRGPQDGAVGGMLIVPRAAYFAHEGGRWGLRARLKWSLNAPSFTEQQFEDIHAAMWKYVRAAGGKVFIQDPFTWKLPPEAMG